MSRPNKRWRGSSSEDEADAVDVAVDYGVDGRLAGAARGGSSVAALAAAAGVSPPSSPSLPGSPPYVPPPPATLLDDSFRRGGTPPRRRSPSPPLFTPRPGTWRPPCRPVDVYERVAFIDEGTYGRVWRARDPITRRLYALKQVKMAGEGEGGAFPVTALREATLLLRLRHPHIVRVREVVVGERVGGAESFYLVMEHCEGDLRGLLESCGGVPLSQRAVKTILAQLCSAVAHLHEQWVLHRDLKTANLLLASAATGAPAAEGVALKVGDFGLARRYGDPPPALTPRVVTLWYRAPEILLGTRCYSTGVDTWSVGCVFAEMMTGKALFQGESEIEQLMSIFRVLGTPTEASWPGVGQLRDFHPFPQWHKTPLLTANPALAVCEAEGGLELLEGLLELDPAKRWSAARAVRHRYFDDIREAYGHGPAGRNAENMPARPAAGRR